MKGDRFFFLATVAHRVLSWVADLPQRERLVGNSLIGHYNSKTGQCDPSTKTLTRELKMGKDSVFEALNGLTERGFFERKSHGGRSHRNAYVPNWSLFEAMNNDRKLETPARAATHTGLSLSEDVQSSLMRDTNEYKSNDYSSSKPLSQRPDRKSLKRQAKESKPKRSYLTHRVPGGRTPSHKEAAVGSEQRRLVRQINSLPDPRLREAAWLQAMKDEFAEASVPPDQPPIETNDTTAVDDGIIKAASRG